MIGNWFKLPCPCCREQKSFKAPDIQAQGMMDVFKLFDAETIDKVKEIIKMIDLEKLDSLQKIIEADNDGVVSINIDLKVKK